MRGGKRDGAGRKKINTYDSTVVKIPLPLKELVKSIVDFEISNYNQIGYFDLSNRYLNQDNDKGNVNQIAAINALIETYERQLNDSPRWAKAKLLIKDLKSILESAATV